VPAGRRCQRGSCHRIGREHPHRVHFARVRGGGIFQATPPLCAGGTDTFEFPSETLTCADGSGTFTIRYVGAPDERNRFTSWHFVGGTGAYAGIKGGGDVVSNTCPPAPCDVYLAGTVRL
jgi:hypothetical protein